MSTPNNRAVRDPAYVKSLREAIEVLTARLYMLGAKPAVVIALTPEGDPLPPVLLLHPALLRDQVLVLLDDAKARLLNPRGPDE